MSIGRRYTALMPAATVSAAQQLVLLSCPSDEVLLVDRVWIGAPRGSGFNEGVGVQILQVTTAGNGTTASVEPLEEGNPVWGGTFIHTVTSAGTTGDILWQDAFNPAAGWQWTPFDDSEVIVVSPTNRVAIGTNTSVSSAVPFTVGVSFKAVGG